jgi:transcriptional regulator with XRE-family HTH domain
VSYDKPLPLWAQQVIELRRARAWSAADLASELKKLREDLPSVRSLTHMIQMDWETGKHRPSPRYRLLLAAVYRTDERQIFGDQAASKVLSQEAHESCGNATAESTDTFNAGEVTTWITATNTSDAAIEHIERVAGSLAQMHTRVPDREVLAAVMQLHRAAQLLLRGGRQRLRQVRELVRLNGDVLAHASVLFSNLGQNRAAEDYGYAALLYLQEADASQATAWYALAKSARWQHNYAAAADFARQGSEHCSVTAMSVQLASYEANAAALLGDKGHARRMLDRAESIAQQLPPCEAELSPWSFPAGRQTIFRVSVLLHTGDPGGALRAAADAEGSWAAGEPRNLWTWAQVRIGAAIACVCQGSLDGAAEQVAPVLDLAPDMRITTVTGWLTDLDRKLAQPQVAASPIATRLRQQIGEFTAGALQEAR